MVKLAFSFTVCLISMLYGRVTGERNDCLCNRGIRQDIYAVSDMMGAVVGSLATDQCTAVYLAGGTPDSLFYTVQAGTQVAYILYTDDLQIQNCTSDLPTSTTSTPSATSMQSSTIPTTPTTVATTTVKPTTSTAATTSSLPKMTRGCPQGWTLLDGGCYIFRTNQGDSMIWEDARTYCNHHHGHLVFINSNHEQLAVASYLHHNTDGGHHHYWIGATDKHNEGVWVWNDPNQHTVPLQGGFTAWLSGQPDSGHNEDCAAMYGSSLLWADNKCHNENRFVCETSLRKIAVTTPAALSVGHYCDPRWVLHAAHCYLFELSSADELTWFDAERQCEHQNGHLVAIETQDEQTFIRDTLQSHSRSHMDVWIGATDNHREGHWEWKGQSISSNVTLTFWSSGEPNNQANEDCVVLRSGRNFLWDDKDCHDRNNYICEKTSHRNFFNIIG